jgi:putative Mn2+ efflux pump MntP
VRSTAGARAPGLGLSPIDLASSLARTSAPVTAILLGLGAGFDNLRAAVALGLLGLSRTTRWRLAVGFAAVELTGPLLGVGLSRVIPDVISPVARPVAIAAVFAIALISFAGRPQALSRLFEHPAGAAGLPILLGIDNVAAGMALGLSSRTAVGSAIVAGSISGAMAASGLWLGAGLRGVLPRSELAATVLLVGFGLLLLLEPAMDLG